MIKYFDTAVVLQEIPDEITLAINITNCPHRCKNCHSPYLRDNIGEELTIDNLNKLLKSYSYITCFCFMGGDANHKEIIELTKYIHNNYPNIKVAMYSGDDRINPGLMHNLDYYKIGPYIEELGPLDKPTTNQKLYRKNLDGSIEDITSKFWR